MELPEHNMYYIYIIPSIKQTGSKTKLNDRNEWKENKHWMKMFRIVVQERLGKLYKAANNKRKEKLTAANFWHQS